MAAQLKSVGTLLAETWEAYTVRALPMLGVLLLSSVFALLAITLAGLILALGMGGVASMMTLLERGQLPLPVLLPVLAVLFLVLSLFMLWGQSAVLAMTVDGDIGIIRALGVGWRRMWSLGWILLLTGGIVMAGSLLIVPGVVFLIWFVFAAFILYAEDRRGLDALFASHGCVRGHFWNTLARLVVIWLLSLLIGTVPLVGRVLSFLFTPFVLLFMMSLYRDLKEARGDDGVARGNRFFWGGLAAVGMVLAALGLVGAAVTLAPQWPELMRQMHHGHAALIPRQGLVPPAQHMSAAAREVGAGHLLSHLFGNPGTWRKS